MQYFVKDVAELVGISIRTLHHYDQIGLLHPDMSTQSGYRLYSDKNLERLQEILFFKEIGFSLPEIKEILDNPFYDRKQELQNHKELLILKRDRLNQMIETVEQTIYSIEGGIKMEQNEMFKGFTMQEIEAHQKKYAEEIKQRYGNSLAYKESEKRTSNYTKEDWSNIVTQSNVIYQKLADGMEQGTSDPEVQALVEEWRNHISSFYYECTIDIFRGLGDMYVEDERFTRNIDKHKEGLAVFLREAIHVYCDKHRV